MANKFKVVAFDLDGTLIDSVDVWSSLFKKVLKKFKIEVSKKDIKNQFGRQYKEIIKVLVPKDKIEETTKVFEKEGNTKTFLNKVQIFPFTKKVLEDIRKKNIKTSIITGNCYKINAFFMKKFQLNRLIDYDICAEEVKSGKPNPEMILKLLRVFNISKKELIYFGDTSCDVEMARNAGIKMGVVLTGVLDRKSAEKLKPDFIFEDIRGVLKIV